MHREQLGRLLSQLFLRRLHGPQTNGDEATDNSVWSTIIGSGAYLGKEEWWFLGEKNKNL
jgi:hypothetical protein